MPNPLFWVLRQSYRAKNSDWPDTLHFVKSLFTVFTAFLQPSVRENRKFGRSELGTVVCDENVRDDIPREYGCHFFDDIAWLHVFETSNFYEITVVVGNDQ